MNTAISEERLDRLLFELSEQLLREFKIHPVHTFDPFQGKPAPESLLATLSDPSKELEWRSNYAGTRENVMGEATK